ncbi:MULTISPECIES: hypothetical protein [Pseudomonas]|uniref:hypothetical protein n=1 Tax=Pseudomonas TaxID=286 RepID=UPI0014745695|nr:MULTISPECIES: hypothetical protein [Pseudomonas]MEC4242339.1 hypothetical protein [Pseudomonas sp. DSV-1]NNB33930.1 hypothetical protein [Pseudomonas fragi]
MVTFFLVMATASGFRSDERKPLPLRAFENRAQAEEWQNVLFDYHLSPPEIPLEAGCEIWNDYKARMKEWERRHPAGAEASQYQHFGVYEVPVGL